MGDQISRAETAEYLKSVLLEAARLSVGKEAELYAYLANKAVDEWLNAVHAVDAAPVVHARWIDENPDDFLDPRMRCSICTGVESPLIKWRYCPNCGARMDKEG